MTPHRLLNIVLATLIGLIMSSAYLLDGPSDTDAARDTQASVLDAQAAAAEAAHATRIAQVTP